MFAIPRSTRGALAPLAGLLLLATRASAQAAPPTSCVDTLSGASLTRVPVYLEPRIADSTARPAAPTVQLVTETAAALMRQAFGARADQLPDAAPRLRWSQVQGRVDVVLRRGQPLAARVAPGTEGPAAAMLVQALRGADSSSGPFLWDESVPGDSLAFSVALRQPLVMHGGMKEVIRTAFAAPVFSVAVPAFSSPMELETPQLHYPSIALGSTAFGSVTLSFVIDTTGRVDPESVTDVWPASKPRPAGDLLAHYRAFVNEAKRAVVRARYLPARTGSCLVPHRMQRDFVFQIREHD